jgi:hypothetical protein
MDTSKKTACALGYKKVLVVGDHCTRFAIANPIKDEIVSKIATFLFERSRSVFSSPARLVSDRGKPLVSAVFRFLCERVGANKVKTSSCHPQTDRIVEHQQDSL